MAGAIGDIALLEQVALVHVGIEFALALHIVDSLRPAHELRDRALRPVAIEYFEAKAARRQIALDRGQRVGGRSRQQTTRMLVAVDSFTHEVVAAEIAQFSKNRRLSREKSNSRSKVTPKITRQRAEAVAGAFSGLGGYL